MKNWEDGELDAVDDCNCVNCRLGRLEKAIVSLSENIAELVENSRAGVPPRAKGKA
ncbi:MAG: hypothetical protein V1934_03740 [Methanobacteriota archaeon]